MSLLSLSLAKLASGTSPQKPPATYTRVNDFEPLADSIFMGRIIRESDLYASIYGKHTSYWFLCVTAYIHQPFMNIILRSTRLPKYFNDLLKILFCR